MQSFDILAAQVSREDITAARRTAVAAACAQRAAFVRRINAPPAPQWSLAEILVNEQARHYAGPPLSDLIALRAAHLAAPRESAASAAPHGPRNDYAEPRATMPDAAAEVAPSVTIEVVQPPPAKWRQQRQLRYRLKSVARGLAAKHEGARYCGHKLHMRGGQLELFTKDVGQPGKPGDVMAYTRGLFRCGMVHTCPTCAASILHGRRREVAEIVAAHFKETRADTVSNGGAYMLTLTMRHNRGMPLRATRDAMVEAWRGLLTGAAWKRLAGSMALDGYVRALEVTHGANGWHVHFHVLILTARAWEPGELELHTATIADRWRVMLERNGKAAARYGMTAPEQPYGVHIAPANPHTTDYIVKLGLADEIASGQLTKDGSRRKGSRTPFAILSDYGATALETDRALWREYVAGIKGTRQLTYSRGLRARYVAGPEATDQQLALTAGPPDDAPSTLCALIAKPAFDAYRLRVRNPELALCEAAESGGIDAVRAEMVRVIGDILTERMLAEYVKRPPPLAAGVALVTPDDVESHIEATVTGGAKVAAAVWTSQQVVAIVRTQERARKASPLAAAWRDAMHAARVWTPPALTEQDARGA